MKCNESKDEQKGEPDTGNTQERPNIKHHRDSSSSDDDERKAKKSKKKLLLIVLEADPERILRLIKVKRNFRWWSTSKLQCPQNCMPGRHKGDKMVPQAP
jgi:hypothetical protein